MLEDPCFSIPGRRLRTHLLLDTPDEFRNRNLFTTSEVRLGIRRGRPSVPAETKREKARLRQKRCREAAADGVAHGSLAMPPGCRMVRAFFDWFAHQSRGARVGEVRGVRPEFRGCSGFYPWLECAAADRASWVARKTPCEKINGKTEEMPLAA